jgi:hypothetical protein
VDGAGEDPLTGACFTGNQNGGFDRRGLSAERTDRAGCPACTKNAVEGVQNQSWLRKCRKGCWRMRALPCQDRPKRSTGNGLQA